MHERVYCQMTKDDVNSKCTPKQSLISDHTFALLRQDWKFNLPCQKKKKKINF